MHGIKPRTLSNDELTRYAAELIVAGPLPMEWAVELLRRLNYYTDKRGKDTASETQDRQLPLPL